jgi:hypothetical protein
MSEDDMTPRPQIDLNSPCADRKTREKEFLKLFPKYSKTEYARTYYTLRKFRNRQKVLMDNENIEDPDPFYPSYLFYCFKGKLLD